jgi:hypothetical protein
MQAKWIFSSTFLPYTGEPIDFLLEDRSEPIHGTFDNGIFHSRWADYSANRVQSWRGSDDARRVAPIEAPSTAMKGAFTTMMKRLSSALTRRRNTLAIQQHSARSMATTMPAIPLRPTAAFRRVVGGNQLSS